MAQLFFLFFALINAHATPPFALTFEELRNWQSKYSEEIQTSDVQSLPLFCQINGFRDRAISLNSSEKNTDVSAWHNSFYAVADVRKRNYSLLFSHAKELGDLSENADSAIAEAVQTAVAQMKSSEAQFVGGKDFVRSAKTFLMLGADQAQSLNVGFAESAYICSDLTNLNIISCSKGLSRISQLAKPVNSVTVIPLWVEVGDNPIYYKTFRAVATKISEAIFSETPPQTTLFDDLKTEFLNQGADGNSAEEYTWRTMALIASGGANAHIRPQILGAFVKVDTSDLVRFIWVLSNGGYYLDRLTAQRGFLYTMPREIQSLCDYGKNYHFWMTAFLAREAMKETKNLHASAAAAFSLQKGYQFAKEGEGRHPNKPFRDPIYSTYLNNMRLDLASAAAGAWFGALSVGSNRISFSERQIEEAFHLTFRGSQDVPRSHLTFEAPTSRNIAKTRELFSTWKKVVNSDAAFKYFESLAP